MPKRHARSIKPAVYESVFGYDPPIPKCQSRQWIFMAITFKKTSNTYIILSLKNWTPKTTNSRKLCRVQIRNLMYTFGGFKDLCNSKLHWRYKRSIWMIKNRSKPLNSQLWINFGGGINLINSMYCCLSDCTVYH